MTYENLVALIHVMVLLPLIKNPCSHDTVRVTVVSTGNVAVVMRCVQAGSSPVHVTVKYCMSDILKTTWIGLHKNKLYTAANL